MVSTTGSDFACQCPGPDSMYNSPVFNAGKAASITTVVVNAPLMGRIANVGEYPHFHV